MIFNAPSLDELKVPARFVNKKGLRKDNFSIFILVTN